MGVQIKEVDVPVCNSFKDRIVKDQLCQQIDLNQFKTKLKPNEKIVFSFFIDFNEEREYLGKNYDIQNLVIIEALGRYGIHQHLRRFTLLRSSSIGLRK